VAPHLDYGVAPLPALPGAKYKAFADYSFYTVPSSTSNAKQDIILLEWLLSPRNTLRWATELGHIPPLRTSNLDSPTMKRDLSDHPQFKAFVLPERDFAPTASIDPQVPYAIPIQDAVAKQLQEYLLGRLKASQVLSAMQKNVQSVVSQNQ
jgi:ABC-type glycerol-3-phosphate transport system substrate-binding protein